MKLYKNKDNIIIELTPKEKSDLHDLTFNYISNNKDKIYLQNTVNFAKSLKHLLKLESVIEGGKE